MGRSWLDQSGPPVALAEVPELAPSVSYRLKVRLLGQPLTRDSLRHQRLNKKLALGVLSSDCISSSAYGSEEMLIVLLPLFGVAAFTILMPLTFVILAVLLVVSLSYLNVVSIYTKAGGSYVVARDNFGPAVAQVAAVALMLDYIVTVAVQAAAGTAALASAIPMLGAWSLWITVAVVVILFYGNLRGLREAGKAFAFPTYFFVVSMGIVIIVGLIREVLGDLPQYSLNQSGSIQVGQGNSVLSFFTVFVLLRAFANGGSSLTGLEAISNGVGAFQSPEGKNARTTLIIMSSLLGFLVLGISWLAHLTHALPFSSGTPTVISEVTSAVLGDSAVGHGLFLLVQLATMLILYTGANTPFNGFPFLTSFVAEDQFLPKQLTNRGHRLAFSNGIIVLAIASIALLLATGAHVDKLVAFYAIGVYTGFTLAGFGMASYFRRVRTAHWRRNYLINMTSGVISLAVVAIFAIVKFTEGAWLIVVIFPVGVAALIRLNRQYRREAGVLAAISGNLGSANIASHSVIALVESVDLATIGAIRYAKSLRADHLSAVHFVIDQERADQLRLAWDQQAALTSVPLNLVDCPDRRLGQAVLDLTVRASQDPHTEVTLLLPRRTYSPILGRLLHKRTADHIARIISPLPRVVVTVVPFDVDGILSRHAARKPTTTTLRPVDASKQVVGVDFTAIKDLVWRQRATIEGHVRSVRIAPLAGSPSLQVELWENNAGITLIFYGRRAIPGIGVGATLRATGMVSELNGTFAMANPTYTLTEPSA
jgi:amino acid transporter